MKKTRIIFGLSVVFLLTGCNIKLPFFPSKSENSSEVSSLSEKPSSQNSTTSNNPSSQGGISTTSTTSENPSSEVTSSEITTSQSGTSEGDDYNGYYDSISDSLTGKDLQKALNSLNNSKRKKTVGYAGMKTFAAKCDVDPDGSGKIIGFYDNAKLGPAWDSAKTWNREHVWPDARGGSSVEGDAHMPRPASVKTNSGRGSKGFGKDSFDPGSYVAFYRGVASRIIFYCAIANTNLKIEEIVLDTDGSSPANTMGTLSDMLEWNLEYLPHDTSFTGEDDLARRTELNRNEVIQNDKDGQGNRNPFIDHPEYACKIWGNTNATTKKICGIS